MTTAQPIFFFHIPKTAGLSMQGLLSQHFAQDEVAAAITWTTMLKLDRKDLSRKKLFQGHFYGPLQQWVGQQCFCFTLLRDPIERALSHYGHVLRANEHYLHRRALELGSLEAYLEDPITRMTISNFQARMLALDFDVAALYQNLNDAERADWYVERYIETTDFGLDGQALLSAAQAKLDTFQMVGITEQFVETLAMLCYTQGWPYPAELHEQNVNEQRTRRSELPITTLQRLEELNAIDIALYEAAHSAFKVDFQHMLADLVSKNARKNFMQRLLG